MRKGQMDELPPSDRENIELLLDAFSSVVSLEQIVSAYCQSGRNPYCAHQMLSSMQRSTPKCSASTSRAGRDLANSSRGYQSDISKDKASFVPKTKEHPTSLGTVSSVIGRDYGRNLPSVPAVWRPKPMKLNSADIPVSEWEDQKDYTNPESMHHEIEGFLFEMLGDGFNLEKNTIHNILGQCGYDVQQSMETLLNLPPPTMEKSEDLVKSHPEEVLCGDSPSSLPTNRKSRAQKAKEKRELEQEILGALFTAPERSNNEPNKICSGKEARRIRPSGRVVQAPLRETTIDYQPIISRKDNIEKNDESIENDYDNLRKAVAEYKTTMKEYYTAAAVAFGNQEYEKARKLREEGDFYLKKAREADDKSAKTLVERNDEDDVTFDFHEFEPETALRFLKVQVANLAGISSFKYLKVIVGSSDGNAKHASRKRRILKFLEKEKKEWTEEGEGWRIVIHLRSKQVAESGS